MISDTDNVPTNKGGVNHGLSDITGWLVLRVRIASHHRHSARRGSQPRPGLVRELLGEPIRGRWRIWAA